MGDTERTITLTDHNTGESLAFDADDRGELTLYHNGEGDPLTTSAAEIRQVLAAWETLHGAPRA